MNDAAALPLGNADTVRVAARIERVPLCSWHTKMRLIICSAWFFDAIDAVAIAYVLPVLIGLWRLAPGQIGVMISVGYAGQLVGSILAGMIAERYGRVPAALLTLLVFTAMSFASAFAWSFESLLVFRFLQGLGLGGETPVMITYINEFAKAERRGWFSLAVQILFTLGLVGGALLGLWVVPSLGWRWMFVIGALPALLALPLRRTLLESPRWLASKGRFAEADQVLSRIEAIAIRESGKPLPALPRDLPPAAEVPCRVLDLFRGIYLRRTLTAWALWICTFLLTYGITTWAPSLFRTVFDLPVQQSLNYGFIMTIAGLIGGIACVVLIDRIGRRMTLIVGLFGAALPLLSFLITRERSPLEVLTLISVAFGFLSFPALSMGLYTAESYPNSMRALGGGIAAAWQRGASMAGPLLVGAILPLWGLNAVFVVFGGVAMLGVVVCVLFAHETRGKVLERLSPELRSVSAPPELRPKVVMR